MKSYAVFYCKSAISNERIQACGDRATIQIDNRLLDSCQEHIAREECRKRGYLGYHMEKGESLLQAKQTTPYREL